MAKTQKQIDKFRELAREQECDQSQDNFDATLQTVGEHRPAKKQADDSQKSSQAGNEPKRR
jgi:hypothetical protein